ncbi:MAG: hypothetical protein RIS56_747, partial [Verrucomicrobiota bacterium]
VGLESLGPSPPRVAAQGTDGETPSLPTCRYRPSRPPGPSATSLVGLESLGPSPPRLAAQGTDGETPSLPTCRYRPSRPPGPAATSRGRAMSLKAPRPGTRTAWRAGPPQGRTACRHDTPQGRTARRSVPISEAFGRHPESSYSLSEDGVIALLGLRLGLGARLRSEPLPGARRSRLGRVET